MRKTALIALALVAVACDEPESELDAVDVPCGIRDCAVGADGADGDLSPWSDGDAGGKADVAGVESAIASAIVDGVLDTDDIDEVFDAAGNRVGRRELEAIHRAVTQPNGYEVTKEGEARALQLAASANLFDVEVEALDIGKTYGGSEIPVEVAELLARARLAGAVAYDVREQDNDGEGVWTPYPATTPSVENMAFDYTEITPTALAEDMADVDVEYKAIVGVDEDEFCDASGCQTFEKARLETRRGGTGNVLAHYDEVFHEDIFARGRSGQKWANNCAILTDGSLHCLPASRRSVVQDVILTNPALSRCNNFAGFEDDCRHHLYHGHIDVVGGVVVGVEVSGRLSRRIARGQIKMIDPIALLDAWGFEIAPDVRIRYGNTSDGVPVRDLEAGLLVAP